MKKAILAAIAFVAGWIWGFLSLRALFKRTKRSLAPSAIVIKAADGYDAAAERLIYALERGRERARARETELRRRFGLDS